VCVSKGLTEFSWRESFSHVEDDHVSRRCREDAEDSTILAHTMHQIKEKERKKGKERKMKLESRYRLVTGNSSVGSSGSER